MNTRGQNMAGVRRELVVRSRRPPWYCAAGMALHRRVFCISLAADDIKFSSGLGPGEHGVPAAAARAALDLYRGLVSPEPDEAPEANGQRDGSHRVHRGGATNAKDGVHETGRSAGPAWRVPRVQTNEPKSRCDPGTIQFYG